MKKIILIAIAILTFNLSQFAFANSNPNPYSPKEDCCQMKAEDDCILSWNPFCERSKYNACMSDPSQCIYATTQK
ncbi:hypothetical protein Xish_00100 [Xenorhabdus ishibashii]|uniref:Kazal-like domain-containing protein n=1 Tax=Xenorhabdus ishibashii TaxID=1034471 RepID=A0A2D0KC56_9GAMM|nr:hypothetical protein Xish_00100 [Xenorhabdus ishibashii]